MNRIKSFFEGMTTACVAHVAAWIALVSVDKIVHLCGHTIIAVVAHILESSKR